MAITTGAREAKADYRVFVYKWLDIPNGNQGDSLGFATYQDRSVQVVGTFGAGGSVSIKGSNDGGTTWAILTDPLGNALTFTAAGLKQIVELTDLIRPEVTAGDGTTAIDVWLLARGANK